MFAPVNIVNASLYFKPQLPPSHVKLLVPKEGGEKRNLHTSGVTDPDHQEEVGLLLHHDMG